MKSCSPTLKEQPFFLLLQLTRQWRRIVERSLRQAGLSDATWRPLLHLLLLGDGVWQKDLAESIGIKGPSLVRLLDTLIDRGLIMRTEDSSDRRAKKLFLTKTGRQLAEQIHCSVEAIDKRILQPFSATDMATMAKYIRCLEDSLNDLSTAI